MAANELETLLHLLQDVIAPDLRELKVRLAALEKQNHTRYKSLGKKSETQYNSLRDQFNSLRDQQDSNSKALVAALGESPQRKISTLTN